MSELEPATPEQMFAIAGNTRLVTARFTELAGKDMRPGLAGVVFLDGWIDQQRLLGDDAVRAKLTDMAACYLGEAMIADIGGRWAIDPKHGLGVELAPDLIAFPFNKTDKHFAEGTEDSVLAFFEVNAVLAKHYREKARTGEVR